MGGCLLPSGYCLGRLVELAGRAVTILLRKFHAKKCTIRGRELWMSKLSFGGCQLVVVVAAQSWWCRSEGVQWYMAVVMHTLSVPE